MALEQKFYIFKGQLQSALDRSIIDSVSGVLVFAGLEESGRNYVLKLRNQEIDIMIATFASKPDARHLQSLNLEEHIGSLVSLSSSKDKVACLISTDDEIPNDDIQGEEETTKELKDAALSNDGLIKEFTTKDIVSLPISDDVRKKTVINTVKKFNYTLKNSIVRRSQIELICDLYMGDLAKNCIVDYLRKHCTNNPQIVDYDEVRTDNFEKSDPWDFYINDQSFRVEVKSSTPPLIKDSQEMESDSQLILGRDIKIIAKKTYYQPEIQPEEFDCHVFPQVYFRCRVPKGRNLSEEEVKLLNESPLNLSRIVDLQRFDHPLFFGWSAKSDIIFFRDRLKQPKWKYGNAVYWSCPLRYSRTLKELVDFADGTVKE